MLTKFYNHERFLTHVNEGKKIINSTKQGAENNPYKIGDKVKGKISVLAYLRQQDNKTTRQQD